MTDKAHVQIGGLTIQIAATTSNGESTAPAVELESIAGIENAWLIHLSIDRHIDDPISLQISTSVPAVDMHGMYIGGDPGFELGYLPHLPTTRTTATHSGIPYLSLAHRNGHNRFALGMLDQLVETRLHAQLSELTRCYDITITKRLQPTGTDIPGGGRSRESVFISTSTNAWPKLLGDYAQISRDQLDPDPLPTPDSAFAPIFCTWTAIHHEVNHQWILDNAQIAADLGFRTWITDDGWHHDNGLFGRYDDVGPWLPSTSKFPDLARHVDQVKALGFRYILWVAPFMIGIDSPQADQYADLLMPGQVPERFDLLQPQKAESRKIVKELLRRLVDDYGLDGLKIDFIDAIAALVPEPTDTDHNHPVGTHIYSTLREAIAGLSETHPDLLIEFRNKYANLAARSYANLYRPSDLPINFTQNRWQAAMLRLLAPDAAVVTDPMLWHPDETDENVAVHLINGIAAVPMISVELTLYPKTHLKLIEQWMRFYNDHNDTLSHGQFLPDIRGNHIPAIEFRGPAETIHAIYDNVPITVCHDEQRQVWILNASTQPFINLRASANAPALITTHDRVGNTVHERSVDELPDRLDIEIGGYCQIRIADNTIHCPSNA